MATCPDATVKNGRKKRPKAAELRLKTKVKVRSVTRRLSLVAYPDFEPLDLTVPFSVFAGTGHWLRKVQGRETNAYTVEGVGAEVGPLRASGG